MNKRIIITGVLSYSGHYIAERALESGWEVLGLEGQRSAGNSNPMNIPITPFDWEPPEQQGRIEQTMRDCDVFVNTYWQRPTTAVNATAIAEQRCRLLFDAAKRAGVRRIVHISVAHAQEGSALPYFHHKGRTERALRELGIPATVLRPAMLFGDNAEQSILVNNWAWCLRHSPLAGLIGDGSAMIHPIHVRDLAEMVMTEASRLDGEQSPWNAYAAVGKECLTLRECTTLLIGAMQLRYRLITPMPSWIAAYSGQLLARLMGGVRLFEHEEIQSLLEGRLAYPEGTLPEEEVWTDSPPIHRFSRWLREEGEQLGRRLV